MHQFTAASLFESRIRAIAHPLRADPWRPLATALLALAVLTLGAAAVRYLNSPLRFDESEWAPQAEGILRHGVPKVLYSEDSTIWTEGYRTFDAHYGMWHPPVYLYSLAVSIGTFGRADWSVRLVSAAWMAASACLLWLILAFGDGRDRPWLLRALPLSIVFLTPLAIEGTFYVDIDNSSLAAAMFLMAYVHLRLDSAHPLRRALWLAAVTAFALWSKLTTPVVMAAAIVLHRWWQRGFRGALLDMAAMIGAVLIFAGTYWAYCAALNYPLRFMIDFSYLGKRSVYTSVHSLRDVLQSVRWNIVWISPAVTLAVLTAIVLRVQRLVRTRQTEPPDLLFIFGAMALGPYVAFGVMGKYTVPAALALAAAAGYEIAGAIADARIERARSLFGIAVALAALHVWIGPLQLRPTSVNLAGMTLAQALADPRNGYLLLSGVSGVLAALLAMRAGARPSRAANWAIGLLIYIAAANAAGEFRLVTARADRSPLRPFVDTGFRDVVAYLNEAAGTEDVILAPKDIGYYFHGRHYRAEIASRDLRELTFSPYVRFVVDSRVYPLLPDWTAIERAGFARVRSVGDYEVFERQAPSPTQQAHSRAISSSSTIGPTMCTPPMSDRIRARKRTRRPSRLKSS